MGVIKKSRKRKPGSSGNKARYKSHSRSGGLVSSYTQKTKSGIRIRVRGTLRKRNRVSSSIRKRS